MRDAGEHIEQLLWGYVDGALSPDQESELRQRFAEQPKLAERLYALADERLCLQEFFAQVRLEVPVRPLVMASRRSAWRPRLALALAASLLAVAGVWWMAGGGKRQAASGEVVARVVEANAECGMRNAEGSTHALRVGDEVRAGARIETGKDGAVKLAWVGEATSVELGECSVFGVSAFAEPTADRQGSGKSQRLDRGRLTATVAKQDPQRPFVLETPHARATVVGTKFSLVVSESSGTNGSMRSEIGNRKSAIGHTRVDVQEGLVDFARLTDGALIRVPAGQLALVGKAYALKAYPAGADHVDGEVVFQDDFSRGLGAWELVLADVDESPARGKTDYALFPDPDGKRLRVEDAKNGKEPAPFAALDARGLNGRLAMRCTRRMAPGEAVSIEWALRVTDVGKEGVAAGWVLENLSLSKRLFTQPNDVTLGTWQTRRLECVPFTDAAGQTLMDVREYLDGQMVSRRHDVRGSKDWAILLSARNAKTSIRGVTIRKLVALDRPAEKPAN